VIRAGLMISSRMGVIWLNKRSRSLGFVGVRALENELKVPWFTLVYIDSEYAAERNLINLIGISIYNDFDIIEVSKRISLRRLIDGGAAMFTQVNRNHHMVRVGSLVIRPLVRAVLRV
jgi:hypothetical protein